jgi:cation:H+ antiporter
LVWLKFLVCFLIILFAGTKLARYGDAIAEKSGLGRIWIGLVLIALVTSMPELVTSISAVTLIKVPDLALGNFMGSCLFNLVIIAVLDVVYRPSPVLSQVHFHRHILPAVIGISLLAIAAGSMLASEQLSGLTLAWVGVPSIVILIFYLIGIRQTCRRELLHQAECVPPVTGPQYDSLSNRTVYFRFALAALAIIGAGIWLAFIGDEIATTYNWSTSFVGSLFIAITTSLPELVVTITAVRLGAIDMAIADILGANMINMANIFSADIFYSQGPVLFSVSSVHALTAAMAIAMTLVVIFGLRSKNQRKTFKFASWYSITLVVLYIAGSYAIYALA